MSKHRERIEGIRQREGLEGGYVNALWAIEELESNLVRCIDALNLIRSSGCKDADNIEVAEDALREIGHLPTGENGNG